MTERGTNRDKMPGGGVGGASGGGLDGGASYPVKPPKPVSMKLFAAWEDRTPSNCIPRLCSLIITRLTVLTPLPGDLSSVSLAVKMQSSKRILRSHEIPVVVVPQNQSGGGGGNVTTSTTQGSGGLVTAALGLGGTAASVASGGGSSAPVSATEGANNVNNSISSAVPVIISSVTDTNHLNLLNSHHHNNNNNSAIMEADLDLNFSLQYPHFIKRDGNRLLIMLQRRKKYKTRTILGYKTLAEGVIRMDAVLQKSMDMVVELHMPGKGNRPGCVLATVRAERVSSIPVDHDNKNINNVLIADRYSDEDEEGDFSSGDDNEDGPGMRNFAAKTGNFRKLDPMNDNDAEDVGMGMGQGAQCDSDSDFDPKDKNARTKISRQRNFKQKFVALLKRFKVPEEIGESRHAGRLRPGHQLDELFQELDELSCGDGDDSGPDVDSLSVGSTPKPSLRPFFTNSRNTLHEHKEEDRGSV